MKTFVFALIALIALAASAQLRQNPAGSLYADDKGAQVGDVVTILIMEDAQASNDAGTETNRKSDISISAAGAVGNTIKGAGSGSVGTGSDFKGSGTTTRNERFRAKLSARIAEVDKSGALRLEGKRSVQINGETQAITINGWARFSDIMPDNTIYSSQLANVTIAYDGDGSISKVQGPGWVTKLLHWLF